MESTEKYNKKEKRTYPCNYLHYLVSGVCFWFIFLKSTSDKLNLKGKINTAKVITFLKNWNFINYHNNLSLFFIINTELGSENSFVQTFINLHWKITRLKLDPYEHLHTKNLWTQLKTKTIRKTRTITITIIT